MDIRTDWRKRNILGAAGGFMGTLAIQSLLLASQKWLPNTVPLLRQAPGEFIVKTGVEALLDSVRKKEPVMHSPRINELYTVAVLAGPLGDYEACRAAAPVSIPPTSRLLESPPRPPEPPLPPEPPPRPPEPPQPPPEPIPDPTRPPPPPPVRL
jgi:hypothetical protein